MGDVPGAAEGSAAATTTATTTGPTGTPPASALSTAGVTTATAADSAAQTPPAQTSALTDAGKEAPKTGDQNTQTEEGKEGDAKPPVQVAPESYTDFKTPEGWTLDPKVDSTFKELAKANNLTQEAAQKFIDLALNQRVSQQQDLANGWEAFRQTKLTEAKADPDIGGQNWGKALGQAGAFINSLPAPRADALRAVLALTGAGDMAPVIYAFAQAGKAISESSYVGGGSPAPKQSTAELMFPGLK
jgi:hypothetical protein